VFCTAKTDLHTDVSFAKMINNIDGLGSLAFGEICPRNGRKYMEGERRARLGRLRRGM
jgi:hypothetical protein